MYVFTLDVGLGQRLQLSIQHSSKNMWSLWSELTFTAASVSWELKLPYQFSKRDNSLPFPGRDSIAHHHLHNLIQLHR